MYNIYLYHTASPPWDLGAKKTKANMLMHMLLAVPGVNKVICLWPRSLLSSTSTCEIVKGYLQVEWNQIPNPPICLLAIYQPLQSNIQHLNLNNTIISSFTIHFKQTWKSMFPTNFNLLTFQDFLPAYFYLFYCFHYFFSNQINFIVLLVFSFSSFILYVSLIIRYKTHTQTNHKAYQQVTSANQWNTHGCGLST